MYPFNEVTSIRIRVECRICLHCSCYLSCHFLTNSIINWYGPNLEIWKHCHLSFLITNSVTRLYEWSKQIIRRGWTHSKLYFSMFLVLVNSRNLHIHKTQDVPLVVTLIFFSPSLFSGRLGEWVWLVDDFQTIILFATNAKIYKRLWQSSRFNCFFERHLFFFNNYFRKESKFFTGSAAWKNWSLLFWIFRSDTSM